MSCNNKKRFCGSCIYAKKKKDSLICHNSRSVFDGKDVKEMIMAPCRQAAGRAADGENERN